MGEYLGIICQGLIVSKGLEGFYSVYGVKVLYIVSKGLIVLLHRLQ